MKYSEMSPIRVAAEIFAKFCGLIALLLVLTIAGEYSIIKLYSSQSSTHTQRIID